MVVVQAKSGVSFETKSTLPIELISIFCNGVEKYYMDLHKDALHVLKRLQSLVDSRCKDPGTLIVQYRYRMREINKEWETKNAPA
jgi:hypothetical protein